LVWFGFDGFCHNPKSTLKVMNVSLF